MINSQSRTAKSIKNSTYALIFFCIEFALKFFSRSVFLKILGDEILGLNSTMMNLLQFLNLAELGIGAAVGFTLYKPIADNDDTSIDEIIQLNGFLYKRISWIVAGGAIVLMCFFPWIFSKTHLPLWYSYATFLVFLLGLLLNYSVNYKQILLSASQLDYKILYSYRSFLILKVLVQIIVVELLPHPYVWWLVTEGVFTVIASISLDITVRKSFKFLGSKRTTYIQLKQKYSVILTKIKQVFYHKICGFILTQTSPLIIYGFLSLTVVTLYSNYMIIVSGVTLLFNSVFNSMMGAIGNLVAENNIQKTVNVFFEIFSIRFLVTAFCCLGILIIAAPLITIWIGPQYVLSNVTTGIIVATLFISLTRTTVDSFLNAYGMYQDVLSPVIEAILNIGCSILLGYYYGLNGILCGTLFSLLGVVFLWKPYFLFRWGFKMPIKSYIIVYMKHFLAIIITVLLWYICFKTFIHDVSANYFAGFCLFTMLNVFVVGGGLLFSTFLFKLQAINTIKRFLKR